MSEKLLAEWFWVDRWDGSSAALLPMEAQGVYRAMLSQAWRRGARLPKDLNQVQRAIRCTSEEWVRSWPLIHQYWREDGDALVNDTQLEVYADAMGRKLKRSKKAKDAADARWNASSTPRSNARTNAPEMPDVCPPSPSPSPRKNTFAPDGAGSWSREACDDWIEFRGGTAPGGRIGKALKPLVDQHAWLRVRVAWRRYLAETPGRYVKPERFAETYGDWSIGVDEQVRVGPTVSELDALDAEGDALAEVER
jgi:uncharacterized protein YdaU (DUF1376 family)